jgi:phosphate transport system protein
MILSKVINRPFFFSIPSARTGVPTNDLRRTSLQPFNPIEHIMMNSKTHLHKELEVLKAKLLEMFALAERAVHNSITAYAERDQDLAEEVIDKDAEINALDVEIDKSCLELLARECPVAQDLRFLLGCIRISIEIERIADEAVNIAEHSLTLSNRPALPFQEEISFMAQKAAKMLELAVQSLTAEDPEAALKVRNMDDEVDALHHATIKKVIKLMISDTPAIERSVYTINIVKRLERIGDLATNVAESVVFIFKGINIRHHTRFDGFDEYYG